MFVSSRYFLTRKGVGCTPDVLSVPEAEMGVQCQVPYYQTFEMETLRWLWTGSGGPPNSTEARRISSS